MLVYLIVYGPRSTGRGGTPGADGQAPGSDETARARGVECIGTYELGALIGSGGMAEVFRAHRQGARHDTQDVVVKRLFPHLARDPKFVQMFLTEARLCSLLVHPNIVPVFDSGSSTGSHFLAMEFIDGCELGEVMRLAPPSAESLPGFAAFVVREIASALAYAHDFVHPEEGALRIVHRDVSPTNVMLDVEGRVRLLDFGIAKALASNDNRTLSGTVKGKVSYMSPQQARGLPIDHRADIFAAGVVLHELLTGRRLFKADNDIATLALVAQAEVVPPSQINPHVPAVLDEICLRALAHAADDRWDNARDLVAALTPVVDNLGWRASRVAAQVALAQTMRPGASAAVDETRTALRFGDGRQQAASHERVVSRTRLPVLLFLVGLALATAALSYARWGQGTQSASCPAPVASPTPTMPAPVAIPPSGLPVSAPETARPQRNRIPHGGHSKPHERAKKPARWLDLESAQPPE